jgi:DNA integrity scanning protein DisA with diadenylate cyclase activity
MSIAINIVSKRLRLLAVAALVVLAACGKDSVAPFEPEVSGPTDNFQLQATNVTNLSTNNSYSWVNTGTRATVNHSTTTTTGTTLLVIKDAAGVTVYSKPLSASLTDVTIAGQAGTWTIQLVVASYSGALNFRVQKL